MVAVNVWYHVGSKNERPGRTGFAHLFEHLMFEGSEHYDQGYFQPLQQAGGLLNGSTNPDRTNYWEVVPTGALDLALWMESDRMGYLLPALTQGEVREPARRRPQRAAAELREPSVRARRHGASAAALFPPDHPYHWLTIGSADDLRAMSLDEVREFFATYYHPANASLTLAGDIDAGRALSSSPSSTSARFPPGNAPAPVAADGDARRADARLRARGSRRAAAPVSRVAFARDVRDRRRRARPRGRSDRPRQDVAAVSARSSTSSRSPPTSSPISIRARSPASSRLRRPPLPASRSPISYDVIIDTLERAGDERPDGSGARTRARADRRAVRLSPADDRRLRRQVRSAECLQRVPRRSRVLRRRSRALRQRDARSRLPPPCAAGWSRRPHVALSVVPHGSRGAGASRIDRGPASRESRRPHRRCPTRARARRFDFPRIHRRVLSNGLEVRAISHRNVPVVCGGAARARRHRRRSGRSSGPGRVHRRSARRRQRRPIGARGLGRARAATAPISTSTSVPMRRRRR